MTATTPDYRSTAGARGAEQKAHLHTYTEAKAGPKTTEFLLTILFVAGAIVAAYINNSDSFAREDGFMVSAIVVAAYAISRGLAKAGVREPYTQEVDLR